MITTWYLPSQRTGDKLCHSCIGSSFPPRGAFLEGRAYAFSQRLHAGSLEALRVSRPEAVVLAGNNLRVYRKSRARAAMGTNIDYSVFYYTYSTISQTLAGAFGFLGAV